MRTKILLILFCLVSVVSCTTDTEVENIELPYRTTEVKNDTEIAKNLKSFNDSIYKKIDTFYVQTRSRNNVHIAKADILGTIKSYRLLNGFASIINFTSGGTATFATQIAIVGASALCGASASYSAYRHTRNGCEYATTMDDYYSSLNKDEGLGEAMREFVGECIEVYPQERDSLYILNLGVCEEVGNLHNDLLSLMEQKDRQCVTRAMPNVSKKISEEEGIKSMNGIKANSYSIDYFSDNDILNVKNALVPDLPAYTEASDYTQSIAQFQDEKILTKNAADVMSLFFDALYNSVVDKTTLDYVVSRYESCITSSSELSIEEKNILLIGLETARHSCSYWYDKGL